MLVQPIGVIGQDRQALRWHWLPQRRPAATGLLAAMVSVKMRRADPTVRQPHATPRLERTLFQAAKARLRLEATGQLIG